MSFGRTGRAKAVSGFVVKVEYFETYVDPTTKRERQVKHRREVSRIYHSQSAAETLKQLLQKQNPDRVYYVHEKSKYDDAQIY